MTIDADVSAFIAQGTTINGLGGDGAISVEAELNSNVKALGIAGAAGIYAGVGAAVSVINDTCDVRALLGARVNNSGAVEEAAAASGRATVGGDNFDNITVDADSDRTIRLATGAAALTGGGSLGAAITVATANGKTEALVGRHTQIGSVTGERASAT